MDLSAFIRPNSPPEIKFNANIYMAKSPPPLPTEIEYEKGQDLFYTQHHTPRAELQVAVTFFLHIS